jgi:2-methylisocitrate lyase-like PEP mutase family enzyme
MTKRPQSATSFRAMHEEGKLLVLANAWDAGSARLIESLGAKAIATTSAGLAWSCGYADGNFLPKAALVDALAAIARVIEVPLSADIEAGYSDDPKDVEALIAQIIDAGAVGINIEDGAGDPALLCAKIESARRAAAGAGVDLFVNARADVYLRKLVPATQAYDEVIARARRYRAAGADGIFVPGLIDAANIQAIAAAVSPLPLNVMASPGLPAAAELAKLGARRLSAGAAISRAVLSRARELAEKFLADGASDDELFAKSSANYASMNSLFATQTR